MNAIDIYGFAGAFTLGMVQSGFKLVGKREGQEGFGVENCEANRHLLGNDWQSEACDPRAWSPRNVEVAFGNPPCSGFSTFTRADFRGMDSPVNQCMWQLIHFAARCGPPQVVVFESVQPAYKIGRPLMQALRGRLEELTGKSYNLHHVLHNAASVGGGALRRRYFFVASQVPFGMTMPIIRAVPTLYEVIGDLLGMKMSWTEQPYGQPATWWTAQKRNESGEVDGHIVNDSNSVERIIALISDVPWYNGELMVDVCKRYYEKNNRLPECFLGHTLQKYIERDWEAGFQPRRWYFDRPAHVIMGNGPNTIVHPYEARTLTYREIARVIGFPDSWTLKQCYRNKRASAWFGKGITVECGSWIGSWIKRAIEGQPGEYPGAIIGDREYYIDVTHTYRYFDKTV